MESTPTSMGKIGIIERDNELAETLQLALEIEGYQIVQLVQQQRLDEQTFSRFIRRHRPPLVLFDIPYPYDDNWELYQQLIQTKGNSRRRFLPMGSFPPPFEDRLRAMEQPFIPKPFELDYLFDTIEANYPRRKVKQAGVQQSVMHNLVFENSQGKEAVPYYAPPLRRGV